MAKILEQNGYKGVYFLQGFLQTYDNFGNLKTATKEFNPNLIQTNLKIELRNF
jgi:anaerobic ribonucleoside-triphosphate reductase activating protein